MEKRHENFKVDLPPLFTLLPSKGHRYTLHFKKCCENKIKTIKQIFKQTVGGVGQRSLEKKIALVQLQASDWPIFTQEADGAANQRGGRRFRVNHVTLQQPMRRGQRRPDVTSEWKQDSQDNDLTLT